MYDHWFVYSRMPKTIGDLKHLQKDFLTTLQKKTLYTEMFFEINQNLFHKVGNDNPETVMLREIRAIKAKRYAYKTKMTEG